MGDSEGQGSLECCSSWGCRVRHNLATEQQQLNRSSQILSHTNMRKTPTFILSATEITFWYIIDISQMQELFFLNTMQPLKRQNADVLPPCLHNSYQVEVSSSSILPLPVCAGSLGTPTAAGVHAVALGHHGQGQFAYGLHSTL